LASQSGASNRLNLNDTLSDLALRAGAEPGDIAFTINGEHFPFPPRYAEYHPNSQRQQAAYTLYLF
jgi:hypothetical protein